MAELMASGDFRAGVFCGGFFFLCLLALIFFMDVVASFVTSCEQKRRQRLLDTKGEQSHIYHDNQKHWSKYT